MCDNNKMNHPSKNRKKLTFVISPCQKTVQ